MTTMPDVVELNLEAIRAICREHGVAALYVFGSSAKGTFDPQSSDIDLQVDLGEYEPGVSGRYIRMYQALTTLLAHEIDLITTNATGNDRFMREVAATRQAIFVA